ncbi:MAG: DUF1573 domain-containing protein [Bacteroidales bacterium]
MRILFTTVIILIVTLSVSAQDHQGAYIAFDRELHDYGELQTDSLPDGTLKFMVYNQGSQPLVLSNVRGCCGTRVNDYTKAPIAPSDSGFVEVQFRLVPHPHRIRRTITIQSNAANRQTAILRVQGEVVESRGDLTLKEQD